MSWDKKAFLKIVDTSVNSRFDVAHVEQRKHYLERYLMEFAGHINGRLLDILDTRDPNDSAYAAAYALFPEELTANYPEPQKDPQIAASELLSDINKVDRIQRLTNSAPIKGLRGIDRAFLREVDSIELGPEPDIITLSVRGRVDKIVRLEVVTSDTFVDLLQDPDITAKKVIALLMYHTEGSLGAERFISRLLDKIPVNEIPTIIAFLRNEKLRDDFDDKFGTLLILDALEMKYAMSIHGGKALESSESPEPSDDEASRLMLMQDVIRFMESVGCNPRESIERPDEGTILLHGNPDASLVASELSALGASNISTSHASSSRFIDRVADVAEKLIKMPLSLSLKDAVFIYKRLLDELEKVVSRVEPRIHEYETVTDDEKLGKALARLKDTFRCIINNIYFFQMLSGQLDFPNDSASIDLDWIMANPHAAITEMAYRLTGCLFPDRNMSGGPDPLRNIQLQRWLETLVPGTVSGIIQRAKAGIPTSHIFSAEKDPELPL